MKAEERQAIKQLVDRAKRDEVKGTGSFIDRHEVERKPGAWMPLGTFYTVRRRNRRYPF